PTHLPSDSVSLHPPHHLHHLHSFPTRRSSDLTTSMSATHSVSPSRARPFGALRVTPLRPPSMNLRFSTAPSGRTGRSRTSSSSRDRKSTRLNSSHVSISYAVFCLKKKKHRLDR